MVCKEARESFAGVILGKFGAPVAVEAERHMTDCKECQLWEKNGGLVEMVEKSEFAEVVLK